MMLENTKIRKELDRMCEQGKSHTEMIAHLLGRFLGQEDIPYELVDYAMNLRPEVMII
jgi:hypothetical protein